MTRNYHMAKLAIAIAIAFGTSMFTGCSPQAGAEAAAGITNGPEKETLKIAQSFLQAAGSGDGETLRKLMAEDFVWHNEGDKSIPWIGPWQGSKEVFGKFMPEFGAGFKTTSWNTDHTFAKGAQAVFMGTMSATLVDSGAETGTFSWAVRVEVQDGKVKSWNWFEDSYSVSKAYHGK